MPDMLGNTPLHIAIERGHLDCCRYLLDKGADTRLLNHRRHGAIHQCVLSKKPDMLDALLGHESQPDIHLGGENGSTALHYCAYDDNVECARVLVKHGAKICMQCNNGFFAMHVAAHQCSNRVLELLIDHQIGECSLTDKTLNALSFVDGDNNKPLHAAVQFGNLGAVRLCLEKGASINEVIEIDKSTPVHMACAQGLLRIYVLVD